MHHWYRLGSRHDRNPTDRLGKPRRDNWVYVVYDARARCLYVGRTMNPDQRWASHRSTQPWSGEAAEVEYFGPYTLQEASAIEAHAIHNLRPGHNRSGSTTQAVGNAVVQALKEQDDTEYRSLLATGLLNFQEAAAVLEVRWQERVADYAIPNVTNLRALLRPEYPGLSDTMRRGAEAAGRIG